VEAPPHRAAATPLAAPSAILDLARTRRTTSPEQRKALIIRDQGCVHPHCDHDPSWCEVHHLDEWWAQAGPTNLNRLALLCTPHHHDLHRHHQNSNDNPTAPGPSTTTKTGFPVRRKTSDNSRSSPARLGYNSGVRLVARRERDVFAAVDRCWVTATWSEARLPLVYLDPERPSLVVVQVSLRRGQIAGLSEIGVTSGAVWGRDVLRRLPLRDIPNPVMQELGRVASHALPVTVVREWSEHGPNAAASQWSERLELPSGTRMDLLLAGDRPAGQSMRGRRTKLQH